MSYRSDNFGLINKVNRKKLISIYKNLYFSLLELKYEDGVFIERNNWVKKEGYGNSRRIVSKKGFNLNNVLKEIIFRWFNLYEGLIIFDERIDYVFFNDKVYRDFLDFIELKNSGKMNDKFKFYSNFLKKIKTKRYCLINENCELIYLELNYLKESKKYNLIERKRLNGLKEVLIDLKLNPTKENIKYFRSCRDEIMESCGEWYNISSNWLNNKIKFKKLREEDYKKYLDKIISRYYYYDLNKKGVLENYKEFKKGVSIGYFEMRDLENLKEYVKQNYTIIELSEKLKEEQLNKE